MAEIPSSKLVINQPIQINAPDDTLSIVMDPAAPLDVGAHVFQLIAVDESGNQSTPAIMRVVVLDSKLPTAVISGPSSVEFGEKFILSGRESSDVPPGRIASYIWTKIVT